MKLYDISVSRHDRNIEVEQATPGTVAAQCPELADLLNARHGNTLFNCMLLAGDEMELANSIIAKVYADPCYHPSMTVLQAIRSINAKLAMCRNTVTL